MQLSQRLPQGLNQALLQEEPLADDVIDLTSGNPTAAGFDFPEVDLGTSAGIYAPLAQGRFSAREALCEMLVGLGRKVAPEQLFLCASTSEAFSYLIKATCNANDFIVTERPGYPLVGHLAELEGVGVRYVDSQFDAKRWSLDLVGFEAALKEGARMVVLVSPNNPTGATLADKTLRAIAALCRKYRVLLVLDEVFAPFSSRAAHAAYVPLDDFYAVASLGGLSKSGMWPGMKLSWIVVAGDSAPQQKLHSALEWIADAYLSASDPIMRALPALLGCLGERQARVRERIARNTLMLSRLPHATVLPRDAGWYAIVRLGEDHPIIDKAAHMGQTPVAYLERHARVATLSGALFDLPWPDALVVSLLGRPEKFDAALVRLAGALAPLPRRLAPGYSAADGRP